MFYFRGAPIIGFSSATERFLTREDTCTVHPPSAMIRKYCNNLFRLTQRFFRTDFTPPGFIPQTQRSAVNTVLQATPQGSNVNEIVSSKVSILIESFCRFLGILLCTCSLPTFQLMNAPSLSPLLKEPHDARINLRTCHAIHSAPYTASGKRHHVSTHQAFWCTTHISLQISPP